MISEKDFDESGEKISARALDYVKFLIDNDLYSFATEIFTVFTDTQEITNSEAFKMSFDDLLYGYMSELDERGFLDEEDNIQYSYADDRQLELFSDEDVNYEFMNHCKH
jgi:hypothetical protein